MRSALLCAWLLIACHPGPGLAVANPKVEANDPYLTALTSGAIGCPPAEIAIAGYQSVIRTWNGTYEGQTNTWAATCRGHQFYCSATHTTQCREAVTAAPP